MWGKGNVNWTGEQIYTGSASPKPECQLLAAKVPPVRTADSRQDPAPCDPLAEQRDISSPYAGAARVHAKSSAPILFPDKA